MLPFDEICQMTEKECEEYFTGKLCRKLGLNRDEIYWNEEMEGCIVTMEIEIIEEDKDVCVNLQFNGELISTNYHPMSKGNEFCTFVDGHRIKYDEHAQNIINLAIRSARNAKRVKELEAEVRLLRANKMALPLPVTDAIALHMTPE